MRLTDTMVQHAKNSSILEYIQVKGIGELIRAGKHYRFIFQGHDTIIIDPVRNRYYHNANINDELASGDLINFCKYFFDMSFSEAVLHINELEVVEHSTSRVNELKETFAYNIKPGSQTTNIENYLLKERQISPKVYKYLLAEKLILEDKFGNLVFNWRDNGKSDGKILGYGHHLLNDDGTLKNKIIGRNSESSFGFNVTLGRPESIIVFEAPVDLMSYWSRNPEIINTRLISLEGVKLNTFIRFMENTYQQFEIVPNHIDVAVDNDRAGINLYQKLLDGAHNPLAPGTRIEGQELSYGCLIPAHNAVSYEVYNTYKHTAVEKEVPLELLFAFHKYETNAVEHSTKPINANKFSQYFNECSLAEGIEKLSTAYVSGNYKHTKDFIDSTVESISDRKWLNYYAELFSSIKVVNSEYLVKDWNDALKMVNKCKIEIQNGKQNYKEVANTMANIRER